MANHMIIGLGGTGGQIIRAFRKLVYQNWRQEDPKGVKVGYLYVDSSDEMMKHNDPTWKILGTSVQLKRHSQLLIRGLNLAGVLDNLNSYPGIAPWLGGRDQFRSIVASADAANIVGGQKRRLGRFLFACRINEFRRQVQDLVGEMERGGTTETVFHVCCGFAGGTGSGSIVDALSQIRALHPDPVRHKILVYGLLPEKAPAGNRAGANYHANGYAALLELNALGVGAYKPYDLAASNSPGKLEIQDPFNCCYLFTDENEAGNRVDLENELPAIMASFLYQKTVAVAHFTWNSLRRQESFETGSQARLSEHSPRSMRPERCRLFFSFGVKQIVYPEEEIREFLTYEFAKQAVLQLRFNNWNETNGFVEEGRNQSFSEYVRQKDTMENWRITDDHICLSTGVLPDEIGNKRWKPISTFWNDLLPNFKTHIRETFRDKVVYLDELAKLCEMAYGQNYRDLGVRKFYETKEGDMKDHVTEIRRRIERELFNDWKNGAKSMHDIARMLTALSAAVEERLSSVDEKALRSRENEAKVEETVGLNRREWGKIGKIDVFGKRDRIFDAQAESLAQLYTHRTRGQGWQYAKKLLEALKAELGSLSSEVSLAAGMISDATDEFRRQSDSRCTDNGRIDGHKQVVRFYDPETIKAFTRRLVKDRTVQLRQTAYARERFAAILGEDQRFSSFNQKIGIDKFVDVLVDSCQESAVAAHNDLISADSTATRILRVNVVDKLRREFGGNREALRTFALDIVSRAKSFLPLNDMEVKRTGPGIPGEARVSTLTIIMPDAPEHREFVEVLRDELSGAQAGLTEVITNPVAENEITLVHVTNVLPARFIRDLALLQSLYDRRVATTAAAMELHSEGDGRQFPSLYVPTVRTQDVLPYLLLAKAMNFVRVLEDPRTGTDRVCVVTMGEFGEEITDLAASTIDQAAEQADGSTLDTLETLVSSSLSSEFLHRTKREELVSLIRGEVDAVRQNGSGPLEPRYLSYLEAAKRAREILSVTRSTTSA